MAAVTDWQERRDVRDLLPEQEPRAHFMDGFVIGLLFGVAAAFLLVTLIAVVVLSRD